MNEKQTLATKGLVLSSSVFCDDGEDAMYNTFPDGHTVKYVPESTCRWVYFDDTVSTSDAYEFGWHYECSECGFDPEELLGADVDHEDELGILVYCPNCGAKVVEA